MTKTVILVMCVTAAFACGFLAFGLSPTNPSYNLLCKHKLTASPVDLSPLVFKWRELRVSLANGGQNGDVMLIAIDNEKGGDEKDKDKKDKDKKDKDKKDEEKEDDGGGWNRLWDAPKLG